MESENLVERITNWIKEVLLKAAFPKKSLSVLS